MSNLISLYYSSVGKKFVVGFTGLFLCSFLVIHFYGNMLLYWPDHGAHYQEFSDFMATNILIRTIEIVLFAGFLLHIITSIILWIRNRMARSKAYLVKKPLETSAFSSRIMFLTGSIVFIFLALHMNSFWVASRFHEEELLNKYGQEQQQTSIGMPQDSREPRLIPPERVPVMYDLVRERFSVLWYDAFYLVALFLLGFHLRHGFQSAFQTFGVRGAKYETLIEAISVIFWLIIPLGFASMPVYFYLNS